MVDPVVLCNILSALRILELSMAGVGPSIAGVRARTKPYVFEDPDS